MVKGTREAGGARQGVLGVPILNKVVKENLVSEQRPGAVGEPAFVAIGTDARAKGPASVTLSEFTAGQSQRDARESEIPGVKSAFHATLPIDVTLKPPPFCACANRPRPPLIRALRHVGGPCVAPPVTCALAERLKVRGSGAVMAALCRTRALTAGSHFLRVFPVSRPCRGAGTENGAGSDSSESTESRTRPGGFASALERHSELQRKAELGPMRVSRGSFARDVVGGADESLGQAPADARRGSRVSGRRPAQALEPGIVAESGVGGGAGRRGRGLTLEVERAAGCAVPSQWPRGTVRVVAAFPPFVVLLCGIYMLDPLCPHSCLPETSAARETVQDDSWTRRRSGEGGLNTGEAGLSLLVLF